MTEQIGDNVDIGTDLLPADLWIQQVAPYLLLAFRHRFNEVINRIRPSGLKR